MNKKTIVILTTFLSNICGAWDPPISIIVCDQTTGLCPLTEAGKS